MSGENEIFGWFENLLAEKGCTVLVQINEDIIFADPDGREWKLNLLYLSDEARYRETEVERLRRLADAIEARRVAEDGAKKMQRLGGFLRNWGVGSSQ